MSQLAPGERKDCEACGVPLIGARSSSNPKSVLPVVLEPHPRGNVLIQQREGVMTGFVVGDKLLLAKLHGLGVVMRINHFADCPQRERFR